jgi:hypothetical protein
MEPCNIVTVAIIILTIIIIILILTYDSAYVYVLFIKELNKTFIIDVTENVSMF